MFFSSKLRVKILVTEIKNPYLLVLVSCSNHQYCEDCQKEIWLDSCPFHKPNYLDILHHCRNRHHPLYKDSLLYNIHCRYHYISILERKIGFSPVKPWECKCFPPLYQVSKRLFTVMTSFIRGNNSIQTTSVLIFLLSVPDCSWCLVGFYWISLFLM